jgi:predicted RND superfamily exporter protein
MLEKFLIWTSKVFRKPLPIVIIAVVLTLGFAVGVPSIKFDNSIKSMLPTNNRSRVVHDYYEDEDRFGASDMILVGIDTDDAYSVKTLTYLKGIEDAVNAVNATLPGKDMAKLLKVSEKDGATVVEALRTVGINEGNYTDTLLPLIASADKLESTFGWDKAFAEKIAKAAASVAPQKLLYEYYENPIDKTQSILTADFIKCENDELVVQKLNEKGDFSPESIATLKDRVASWDIYHQALVSDDGKLVTVLVSLKTSNTALKAEVNRAVTKILDDQKNAGFKTYIDGEPVIEEMISSQMFSDIFVLIPLVVIMVLGILYLCFRNVRAVAYSAAAILFAVVSTMGLMSFCNVPISIVGITIPVLLVAIVSAYGIHQMNHYLLAPETDKLEVLDHNMKSVGLAITLSGIAVMIGFGALIAEEFVPIKNFGIFTAIGDFIGLFGALYVMPSLILLSRKPKNDFATEQDKGWISAILHFFQKVNRRHSKLVIVVSLVLCVAGGIGATKVVTELNNVSFFKKSNPIHVADDHLNDKLAGTEVLNVVLDSDLSDPYARSSKAAEATAPATPATEVKDAAAAAPSATSSEVSSDDLSAMLGDTSTPTASSDSTGTSAASASSDIVQITTPEVLNKIEQFSIDVKKEFPFITKVLSFNDPLKKMNQEMNGGNPDFFKIPQDQNLISQYLMIFTGDVHNVLSSNHDKLRVSMTMKRVSTAEIEKVRQYSMKYFENDFLDKTHTQVEVTGTANLYNVANILLVDGMIKSVILCVLIVFVLLLLVLRSFRTCLISLVPIIMTMILNFGLMGVLNIPLNVATAIVSSIAIGIGVDYSIHFVTWYRNELRTTPDISLALENTIYKKGRGILYNMFVIFGGFIVLVVSNFVPLIQFGSLVAICTVFSAIGALAVVPAIILLLSKRGKDFLYLGTKPAAK